MAAGKTHRVCPPAAPGCREAPVSPRRAGFTKPAAIKKKPPQTACGLPAARRFSDGLCCGYGTAGGLAVLISRTARIGAV